MKRKLLLIDTETGGLDSEKFSILSLAALVLHEDTVEDEYYTLICEPEITVEDAALKVNGLTPDALKIVGVSPSQAVNGLTNMLQKHGMHNGTVIVAHNAAFDVGFLKRLYRLAGVDFSKWFSYRSLCTHTGALLLDQAGRIVLPGGSASLDNLAKLWHIDLLRGTGHNALADARATALVYRQMVSMLRS